MAAEREIRFARRRRIEAGLPLVNLLIEVADARAPVATRSPVLSGGRFRAKARVVALLREDLAVPTTTRAWLRALGGATVALDAASGRGLDRLLAAVRQARPDGEVRAMIVGLPNLGKSSLVNRLAGAARAATGNRPGITTGEQWVRARPWLRLLDEPGVLPGGSSPLLAALGCVPDGAYDPVQAFAAAWAVPAMRAALAPAGAPCPPADGWDGALAAIAREAGALRPGGSPDIDRAARQTLARLRDGRLGRLSLEEPLGAAPAG